MMNAESTWERAALAAVDEYFDAFNSRDAKRFSKTLHYPHMRISAAGNPTIWQTREEFAAGMDFDAIVSRTFWARTQLDWKRIVQSGRDKVHVLVGYTRYDGHDNPQLSEESLYVLTRHEGRWAIQMRSSFLEQGMQAKVESH